MCDSAAMLHFLVIFIMSIIFIFFYFIFSQTTWQIEEIADLLIGNYKGATVPITKATEDTGLVESAPDAGLCYSMDLDQEVADTIGAITDRKWLYFFCHCLHLRTSFFNHGYFMSCLGVMCKVYILYKRLYIQKFDRVGLAQSVACPPLTR